MKMPRRIDPALLAPCGMNCMVCYRHLAPKTPCPGCRAGDGGKPGHCRACALKDCAKERGHTHCFQCGDFPCKRIRNLEKSYQKRYGVSLVANSETAGREGVAALLDGERRRWTCPACGGAVSLHDGRCGDCGHTVRE